MLSKAPAREVGKIGALIKFNGKPVTGHFLVEKGSKIIAKGLVTAAF